MEWIYLVHGISWLVMMVFETEYVYRDMYEEVNIMEMGE